MRGVIFLAVGLLTSLNSSSASSAVLPMDRGQPVPALGWLSDYADAVQRARNEQKMVFIHFYESEASEAQIRFESKTLTDPTVQQHLGKFVLARLPVSTMIGDGEESMRLLDHDSFRYMYGQSGLAVIDMKHKGKPYYGHVVSCFPYDAPAYYSATYESAVSVKVILALPSGSITQRTMAFAVRMHPERPASTQGRAEPVLLDEAEQHSRYQARIRLLGHHGWAARARRITSRLQTGSSASEVCAESWTGSRLVTACLDCVNAWRHSSGHWSAVSARQPAFGYDICRGSNGVWYATGIFGG